MNQRDTEALRGFDELPDESYVRAPVVAALNGISMVTVWRWAKNGTLPPPKKLGPATSAWRVGELRAAKKAMA